MDHDVELVKCTHCSGDTRSVSPFGLGAAERIVETRRSIQARARAMIERFPQVVESTMAQAELAIQGRLVLCGTDAKPYFVGNPPTGLPIRLMTCSTSVA